MRCCRTNNTTRTRYATAADAEVLLVPPSRHTKGNECTFKVMQQHHARACTF